MLRAWLNGEEVEVTDLRISYKGKDENDPSTWEMEGVYFRGELLTGTFDLKLTTEMPKIRAERVAEDDWVRPLFDDYPPYSR